MGFHEFPYSPEQQGWGIWVTLPGTGLRSLIGIFKDEDLAHSEAEARRKQKAFMNPRVVKWTEAEYNKAISVYDIHFLWCKDRESVAPVTYRDPAGQSFDTNPTPDKTKRQFTSVKFFTDVRSMIAEGRGMFRIRAELKDHAANQLEIPPTIPLFTAKNNWAEQDYQRYVAFIRVNDKDILVNGAVTRNKLIDDVHFGQVYSHHQPSIYYRHFRTAYGFEQSSNDYSTDEMRKDSDRQMFAAVAAMAGASNESIQNILKEDV